MAQDTRERLLDQAEALFAERGFYGVSIAAIASELGLTKQALLHHYGSKEKLYGEVLKRISSRFMALKEQLSEPDPVQGLKTYFLALLKKDQLGPHATTVLMRELLDNKRRADTAGTWYLKGFLQNLIDQVKEVSRWQNASDAQILAFVYQILGAINYFEISQPTLTGIFGQDFYQHLDESYPDQLLHFIDVGLAAGPPTGN
ncbi:MAG: TetR/AcrR family transcriptional regulator [Pseudomonadota bacterium]